MGCHTWFYKKVEVSYEDAKLQLIKSLDKNIKILERWVQNPNDKRFLMIRDDHPYYTLEYTKNQLDIYERKKRIVEKGLCKEAVLNKYSDCSFEVFRYIKGKGHYKSLDLCDIFRIGNYPPDTLFSLQETLDFIEKNKDKVYYYHFNDVQNKDWKQQLEEFWKKYPDGMIDFG